MNKELTSWQLKKQFDLKKISMGKNIKYDRIIGQDRAVSALQFGLEMEGCGYNIYVSGSPGTGKMTSVKAFLDDLAKKKDTPPDWCYVNNFRDPYQPNILELSPGTGNKFKTDMENLIQQISAEIPKAFESDEYSSQKEKILNELKNKRDGISNEINNKAVEKGFNLRATPVGLMFIPVKDNHPMNDEELKSISEEERKKLEEKQNELQKDVKSAMKNIRKLEKLMQEKVTELDKQIVRRIIEGLIEDTSEKYSSYNKVKEFLQDVKNDIIENVEAFKLQPEPQQLNLPMKKNQQGAENITGKYHVNVLVDNSMQKGAPVIVEFNPTYNNLLGRIEKEIQMGALTTDFTMIKPGSLPRANGGYLVIPADELLRNYYSYDGLKRALRSSELQIEELSEKLGFITTKTLRPQAIPLNVKVVIIGAPYIYYLMQAYDTEFQELFKVKADYDSQMANEKENIKRFIGFVSAYCKKENLNPLDKQAVINLLEYASRIADNQEKLSTEFGHLSDIIREADYWSRKDNSKQVKGKHVKKAVDEKIYRSNLIQVKIQEMIDKGILLINTTCEKEGQVNGLSVISLGDYQFGRPNRITATAGPGNNGIIDIEREVKLGGPIHSKGIFILNGYMVQKYSLGKPVTLAARLVFEQSYTGVEGDSASAAETFALISALAEVPVKQSIAVTGSMNQHGEIQAIGGVNHKIEGFFDVCNMNGLTGEQGVIIPESNKTNLMLRDDIIQAVENGQFHVWTMKTIDQGVEILTGMDSGKLKSDNTYPQNSINEKVRRKLREFTEKVKESHIFSDGEEKVINQS